jgi:hypothetical protein
MLATTFQPSAGGVSAGRSASGVTTVRFQRFQPSAGGVSAGRPTLARWDTCLVVMTGEVVPGGMVWGVVHQ